MGTQDGSVVNLIHVLHVKELYSYHVSFYYYFIILGCGHCKRLAPVYEEVGKIFENSPDVLIAKVDADADKQLGGRFGVRGFPTLKFFPKGSTTPDE